MSKKNTEKPIGVLKSSFKGVSTSSHDLSENLNTEEGLIKNRENHMID